MRLPIYQHPSLTVLVDDSEAFLSRLQFELGPAVPSKAFSDPRKAVAWLRRQHAAAAEHLLAPTACDGALMQPHCVALAAQRIFRIGFRPQRFMLPSVIVADCRMPKMSGVELFEALADLPCKKILLTSAADDGAALDAFNRGLIDRAIKKSDGNALDQLVCAMASLQQRYFDDRSAALCALATLPTFSFIGDPAVAKLVQGLITEHAIVEHYLYAQPGGLLLYDAAGRARLLVIETAEGMQSHHEVARDSGAPPSLLQAIETRCIIPFFRNGDGMYDDSVGERWYRHCAPAQVCLGAQPYFWALFDLEPHELPEPVAPFARFQAGHPCAA
jgi:CheY-like chemotaxis protein